MQFYSRLESRYDALPKFIWGLSGKTYTDPAEYDVGTLLSPGARSSPCRRTALMPDDESWADFCQGVKVGDWNPDMFKVME